jgi:ADP-L-glycero-D-manno-heptose 6-epimerase
MRLLVTGTEGFIGKNVYQKLMKIDDVTKVTCLEKDYMNHIGWETTLAKCVDECDAILHIGAISDTMLKDPNEMLKYNYLFSKELFDLALIYEKKVVYSSSAANTGENGTPSNIYGWSKYLAEEYGSCRVKDFYALRYFNVYGPGEEHKGKMASVAYQAHSAGRFMLFPKKPLRDFVYIDDVVDATLYPLFNDVQNGVYEVGSGEARSFEDVLELMEIPYEYKGEYEIPKGYQFYTKSSEIKFMSGWKPKYNLEKGIKKYKEYLNESM